LRALLHAMPRTREALLAWALFFFSLPAAADLTHEAESPVPAAPAGIREAPLSAGGCPHELFEQVFKKDESGSWMSLIGGHKPQKNCSASIADHFGSAAELEQALQSIHPNRHSFAQCFQDKQYSGIAEGLKKSAIAELFLMTLRLESGVQQTREIVKEIDGLMGRGADAASCVDSSQLKTLTRDTAEAAKLISQIREGLRGNPQKAKQAREAEEAILLAYPWLVTEEIRPLLDKGNPSEEQLRGVIESQLNATRRDAELQHQGAFEALECVPSATQKCLPLQIKALESAPDLDLQSLGASPDLNTVQRNQALDRLASIACVQEMRGYKKEMGAEATGAVANIALTVATAGAGSLASGAAALAKGAQATQAAGRLGKVGQILGKARITPLHRAAARAPLAVLGARSAVVGADSYVFGAGVAQAIAVCSASESRKIYLEMQASKTSKNCYEKIFRAREAQAESRCLAQSVAAVAGLLPFVPDALAGAMRIPQRFKGIKSTTPSAKPALSEALAPSSRSVASSSFKAEDLLPFDGRAGFTQVAYEEGLKLRKLSKEAQEKAAQELARKVDEAEALSNSLMDSDFEKAIHHASEMQYFLEMRQTLLNEGGMTVGKELLERGLGAQ